MCVRKVRLRSHSSSRHALANTDAHHGRRLSALRCLQTGCRSMGERLLAGRSWRLGPIQVNFSEGSHMELWTPELVSKLVSYFQFPLSTSNTDPSSLQRVLIRKKRAGSYSRGIFPEIEYRLDWMRSEDKEILLLIVLPYLVMRHWGLERFCAFPVLRKC